MTAANHAGIEAAGPGEGGEAKNVEVLRYAAFTDDPASGNPADVVRLAGS